MSWYCARFLPSLGYLSPPAFVYDQESSMKSKSIHEISSSNREWVWLSKLKQILHHCHLHRCRILADTWFSLSCKASECNVYTLTGETLAEYTVFVSFEDDISIQKLNCLYFPKQKFSKTSLSLHWQYLFNPPTPNHPVQ